MSLDSQSPTAPYESSSFATPQAGAQQPVLYLEPLMNTKVRGALLSHRLRGEGGGASHQRELPPSGGIYIGTARRPPPSGWFQLNALGFINRNCIAVISGLRPLSPLWCFRHHLSPRESVSLDSRASKGSLRIQFPCHPAKAGAQQPMLYLEPLMNTKVRGALFCHRLRGKSREAGKGEALFRRP